MAVILGGLVVGNLQCRPAKEDPIENPPPNEMGTQEELALDESRRGRSEKATVVPFVRVIVNPAAFDEARIVVVGVIGVSDTTAVLYGSESEAEAQAMTNGLVVGGAGLSSDSESLHGRWVAVRGTFDADLPGPLGLSRSGGFSAVEWVRPWEIGVAISTSSRQDEMQFKGALKELLGDFPSPASREDGR